MPWKYLSSEGFRSQTHLSGTGSNTDLEDPPPTLLFWDPYHTHLAVLLQENVNSRLVLPWQTFSSDVMLHLTGLGPSLSSD